MREMNDSGIERIGLIPQSWDIIKTKYPEIYNIIKEATIVDENKRPNISQICDMLEMIK